MTQGIDAHGVVWKLSGRDRSQTPARITLCLESETQYQQTNISSSAPPPAQEICGQHADAGMIERSSSPLL